MRKWQSGLSLIELMISITLGIVLMTGVMQMFLSSRVVFSTQQGLSRIQESGRLAMELLARDIRMAGYLGCVSRTNPQLTNTLNNQNDFNYRMNIAVEGYTHADGATPGSELNPQPLPDTDFIVIRSASGNGATVAKNNDAANIFLTHTGTIASACPGSPATASYSGICTGDILVISDCVKARIFQATNVSLSDDEVNVQHAANGTPGNVSPSSWGGASNVDPLFDSGADVLTMNHIVYYIGDGASGEPALFQNINGAAQSVELLEGVENMHLTYSRQNSPDSYQTVAELGSGIWNTDVNRVVSVRIELLLRSTEDGILEDPQSYVFPSGAEETVANDHRMRQVFTNTIGIRSRLP